MEEKKPKVFVDGMIFKAPDEELKVKCPWIKGRISFKVASMIQFLNKHNTNSGWVNVDLKKSQKGGLYLELNAWTPTKKELPTQGPVPTELEYPEEEDIDPADIPF